jgi:hypothetical protein
MTLAEMYSYMEQLKQQRRYANWEQQIDLDIAIGELEAAIQIEQQEECNHDAPCYE